MLRGEPYGGPLTKPSKLGKAVAKYEKRQQRQAVKKRLERQAREARAAFVLLVWARDRGACRVCGVLVTKASQGGDPRLHGHVHEIQYRSAGGSALDLKNTALVCGLDHDREHRHLIEITGTGDHLHITERNVETGRIVRVWESKLPESSRQGR